MNKSFQAVKGMNDCLPSDSPVWQYLEKVIRDTVNSYGYAEIRMPIVEKTDLFCRSIGEVTDIVEKEMYTFVDKGDESLTLRPEGTASCVRAGIEHGLLYNQQQRLWYMGPMFRREKPQKGRYRQFYQFGMEAFGIEGPDIDAELIAVGARLWKILGFADQVELQINSLGSHQSRESYKQILTDYFTENYELLDEDSKRRLNSNPLRILDSKNSALKELIFNAPKLNQHLDEASQLHFEALCTRLDSLGIKYKINSTLVRGLDYYNRSVFEWVTSSLGAQGTICAGGRYDGLVEQLGGKPTQGCGFAMGLERIILLLEQQVQLTDKLLPVVDVYWCTLGERAEVLGAQLAELLRDNLPKCRVLMHCGGGNFKKQLKRADKSGAKIALILAEDEVNNETITIKFLRVEQQQIELSRVDLIEQLPELLIKSIKI